MKLDQNGIAVADLLGAARNMEALGLVRTEEGQLGPEAMEGYPGLNSHRAFYGTAKGDSPILLLQPLDAQGPIHDFLGAGKAACSISPLRSTISRQSRRVSGYELAALAAGGGLRC